GDWVMTGSQSLRNYWMAGGPEFASYGNAITTQVGRGSLAWPSGWEFVKGFIGQRIYNGAATAASAGTGASIDAAAIGAGAAAGGGYGAAAGGGAGATSSCGCH